MSRLVSPSRVLEAALAVVLASCGPRAPAAPGASNLATPRVHPVMRLVEQRASRVVAAGDDVFVAGGGTLLISRDRGGSFTPWPQDPALCVTDLLVAPHGGTLYVRAEICPETDVQTHLAHLYRSIDDGVSWTDLGETTALLRGCDPSDPRIVYADDTCAGAENCRSDDGGASWQPLAVPPPSPTYATLTAAIFVADDGALYYAPPHDPGYLLYRSLDRGHDWDVVLRDEHVSDIGLFAALPGDVLLGENLDHCALERSAGGRAFTEPLVPRSCEPGMSISGDGDRACAVLADADVVVSNDAGATWLPVALPDPAGHLRYRCIVDGDRVLVAGEDGVYAAGVPW